MRTRWTHRSEHIESECIGNPGKKKTPKNRGACGASRVRTGDPLLAKQMRYQLRHSPECIEICKVGPGGLEPPTSSLSGMRSNHLSYGPLCFHTSGYLTPNRLSVNSREGQSACRASWRGFPRFPHRIHAPPIAMHTRPPPTFRWERRRRGRQGEIRKESRTSAPRLDRRTRRGSSTCVTPHLHPMSGRETRRWERLRVRRAQKGGARRRIRA